MATRPRTESTAEFYKYYSRRGYAQRGDEETAAFSDDEGPEDSSEVKRERRDRVQLLNATKSELVHLASQTPGLENARVAVASMIDSNGRVGVGLTGMSRINQETMTRARQIDRSVESELSMETLKYVNNETQTAVSTLGARLTFNAIKVIDALADSQRWTWNMGVGLVFLVTGLGLVYLAVGSVTSYL